MWRALFPQFFHRPALRGARMDIARDRGEQVRQAQFLSFVSASGCLPPRRLAPYDAALRRRRWMRRIALASMTVLGLWVALESARALAMF